MTGFAWTAAGVRAALGLAEASWDHAYTGVSTDTRTLQAGSLFVALAGERYDAHDYLGDARLADVGGVVVRRGTPVWPGFDWFEVDDTKVALGQLARFRRDQFTGPVVAVTGTNGKTSTKELIAAALGARFVVHRSLKNLNNTVGVPLTVLAAPLEATAWVVECGASLPGEIARLRDIVHPTIAVVTNVGAGHLEGFGGMDGVLAEKLALTDGVASAVVGLVPPALAALARKRAKLVVTAGLDHADWTAEALEMLPDGRPRFTAAKRRITLPLRGRHMAANAMLALAAAEAAGVPPADAAAAIEAVAIPGGRSEITEVDGITLINDCYNANPQSFQAALDLLSAVRGGRRAIVVAGSMRELGADAERLHRETAEMILAAHPDLIVAIGDFVAAFEAQGERVRPDALLAGPTPETVGLELRERLQPGDVVLLKASRGVQLERLIPILWPAHAGAEAQ